MRTWSEPKIPSFADFRKGGESRRQWRRYWLHDSPGELIQWFLFHLYAILPIALVSRLGALGSTNIIPRMFPGMVKRTMINLRRFHPDWTDDQLREVCWRQFANLGRLHAEYAVLHRLMSAGRIKCENSEYALDSARAGPVIFLGVHTGNFEVIGPVAKKLGIPAFFTYEPQPSPMQNYIRRKVWSKNSAPGSRSIPPGPAAALEALRWLRSGKSILLFCDEAVNGLSVAPFFGDPPHIDSNYAIAARYARAATAKILPFHVVRNQGAHFTVVFGREIELAKSKDPKASLLDDVTRINAAVEPVVRAHLDQWYWLNWPVPGVAY